MKQKLAAAGITIRRRKTMKEKRGSGGPRKHPELMR